MATVITTIYFDGQFWKAIIEKQEENGTAIGEYTFGAEPSNNDIKDFYLNKCWKIRCIKVNSEYHLFKNRKKKQEERQTSHSKEIYKINCTGIMRKEKLQKKKIIRTKEAEEKYLLKKMKKKQKKKGH